MPGPLQSEGLRTDQMVPGVRTQPPPHHDRWSVYGQCMVSGSERGAWSREEAAAILDCIASLEWTGVGCDNGPDIQLYAQIVPLVLCCGGECWVTY